MFAINIFMCFLPFMPFSQYPRNSLKKVEKEHLYLNSIVDWLIVTKNTYWLNCYKVFMTK